VKTFEEIYSHFLALKLNGKNATFRYSRRNKLCHECPLRLKCATDIVKKCPIRESVNKNLESSKKLFNRILQKPKKKVSFGREGYNGDRGW
jgi:hypothetical protein